MKECETLIVDFLNEEFKVGLLYTQSILGWEGFPGPANTNIAVSPNAWVELAA